MHRFINRWQFWLLCLLIGLGFCLRTYHMGVFPPGLTTDEAAITYDAWGLSLDGKDQWGQRWSLLFTSLGDGKLPLTHYVLALGFKVFGFQIYGIRLLAALCGTALIWGTYLLTNQLLKRPTTALLAAALVTFSPWTIHFSRFGLEAGIAVTLATFGLIGLFHQRIWGMLCMVLAVYTYHSSLIVMPLLFLTVIFAQQKTPLIRKIMSVSLFGLLVTPLIVIETQLGWTRATQTVSLPRSIVDVGQHVLAQFSPDFWLLGKQPNYRQAIPGFFVLLLPEVLPLLIGLWTARKAPKQIKVFGGIWLGAALLPSLIGQPSPHTIRAFHLVPLIFIVEAVGWTRLISHWQRTALMVGTGYLIWWGMFWSTYTSTYVNFAAGDYGYGYEQVMKIFKQKDVQTTTFVISPFLGQPYLYTLLYWRISPPEFRAGGLANMVYRPIHWPEPQGNILYAGSASEIPPTDPRVVTVISYPLSTQSLWVIAH